MFDFGPPVPDNAPVGVQAGHNERRSTMSKRRTREEIEHRDRILAAADHLVKAELGNDWTWTHSKRKSELLKFLDTTPIVSISDPYSIFIKTEETQ